MSWQRLIHIDHLVPSELNPRPEEEYGDLKGLASSITTKGLLQQLVVRPLPPDSPSAARRETIIARMRSAPGLTMNIHGAHELVVDAGIESTKEQARDALRKLEKHGVIERVDIKSSGAKDPVTWRLVADAEDPEPVQEFEIVCGHRRHRAAVLAGLERLPSIVRQLTDVDALEAMLVENRKRQEVSPLSESNAIIRLEGMGQPLEDIAERMGVSLTWVRNRKALGDLNPRARSALSTGRIPLKSAVAIAVLPQDRQVVVTERVEREPEGRVNHTRVQNIIRGNPLSAAPWDLDDKSLGGRGACATCPHQTGRQEGLWSGAGTESFCTDDGCWQSKRERLVTRLRLTRTVLEGHSDEVIYVDNAIWPTMSAKLRGEPPRTWSDLSLDVEEIMVVTDFNISAAYRKEDVAVALEARGFADDAALLLGRRPKSEAKPSGASKRACWDAMGSLVEYTEAGSAIRPTDARRMAWALLTVLPDKLLQDVAKRRGLDSVSALVEDAFELSPSAGMGLLVELAMVDSSMAARRSDRLDVDDPWLMQLTDAGVDLPPNAMRGE